MKFNELRKDYLLDRWVVIATERSRRPTDFAKKKREKAKAGVCPLCPGNEHMTPPAVLVYLKSGRKIRKAKDENGFRHKNWVIRCVPNLYPAFTPPKQKTSKKGTAKHEGLAAAVGHHEVLVESPRHNEHPADAKIQQLTYVINAYRDRLKELASKPYVKYVSIFRNHGLEAGASLSHAHSQIIATPFVPSLVQKELKASRKFWKILETKQKMRLLQHHRKRKERPKTYFGKLQFCRFCSLGKCQPNGILDFPQKTRNIALRYATKQGRDFSSNLKNMS